MLMPASVVEELMSSLWNSSQLYGTTPFMAEAMGMYELFIWRLVFKCA